MNIYLIEREDEAGDGDYDAAVVIAESAEAARLTPPCGILRWDGFSWVAPRSGRAVYGGWTSPDKVDVTLIGTAVDGQEPGVVCASVQPE